MDSPKPTDIRLHKVSRVLEVSFDDGNTFNLPCEYLRVNSPSAEVQGHGPSQRVLQTGKRDVNIDNIIPVGNYAVGLYFSDGHSTGIYSWKTLHELGLSQEKNWADYLQQLEQAGASRDP